MPIYELDDKRPDLPGDGRYWIADTAVLIGHVRLNPDSSVWWGAVLRGDNEWIELGVLHGCAVGDNSLVGMGAIMLNGARIGKNCLVGAGALITEGKEFPDNSMIIGAPARRLRDVDEAAVRDIAFGADVYVKRHRQYAKGLRRIA